MTSTSNRADESFQSLLLRHRGRTGLTQRGLAARMGVHMRSVQDWEGGVNYPSAERLRVLIAALLESEGLTPGHEATEAEELWAAVLSAAPRMRTSFDQVWLASIVLERGAQPAQVEPPVMFGGSERGQDWGDAPDFLGFVGRAEELATLRDWVLTGRSRVVAVLGMGGIGKTSILAKLANDVSPAFQRTYWRGLRNAPSPSDWLAGAIGFLSGQQMLPPESQAEGIRVLLELLRDRPSLLVLDNFETLLEPGRGDGSYRDGFAGYGTLLHAIGEGRHQSCLVLTSRETPPDLAVLDGAAVRTLELGGLGLAEGQAVLAHKQLSGDEEHWARLITQFGGNGLALKVVGERIRQVFGGDIGAFLEQSGSSTVFGGIRRLLAEQIERSSALEQNVLRVLAIDREAQTLAELIADLGPGIGRGAVLEAVEALRRRSLLERAETAGAAFTLQSVVLEYVTERLVDQVRDEIARGLPVQLVDAPLMRAQAKDYVRRSQERLIGEPILRRLKAEHGVVGAEHLLLGLLEGWRNRPLAVQGYGPGTVVNLLRLLRGDLKGLDLSNLLLRQVYLQEVELHDANLAGAELQQAFLADAFERPISLAMSADGSYLAACTSPGGPRVWRVADRTPILVTEHKGAPLHSVALSGDGQRLATGGPGHPTVTVLEVPSGRITATLTGDAVGIWQVALSRDGTVLAARTQSGAVEVWDVRTGLITTTLQSNLLPSIKALALSADGATAVCGERDGSVTLWDVASGEVMRRLPVHGAFVSGVGVSADGMRVAVCDMEGRVEVWSASNAERLCRLTGHTGAVWDVAISAAGNLVASAGADGTARLWNVADGHAFATLQGHTGGVTAIALSADGRLLASGSADGSIRVWENSSGRPLVTFQGQVGTPRCAAMSADGRIVANGHTDGTVTMWDAASGRHLVTVRGHSDVVYGLALTTDGSVAASCSSDGSVKLWDTWRGEPLATLDGLTGGIYSLAMNGDCQLVAGGCGDGSIGLWDAPSGRLVSTLEGLRDGVLALALTPDGSLVVGGGGNGVVKLWEVASGDLQLTISGSAAVRAVALTADGQTLAVGSEDGRLKLWHRSTGRISVDVQAHPGAAAGVALIEDARLVASGGNDGVIRIWDASDGELLDTLEGHSGVICGLAASCAGDLLASVSVGGDGSVRLWDVTSRACVRTLHVEPRYARMDITDLKGITAAQRHALITLGAVERVASSG